ncbi:NAD(P)/FAD-dependent oxidoreductase [Streptomyces tirandamycinicus]|uniref:FAD/NAD(P)-binding oxidoreductase n=1 Tax=Streptomyces tirandamycinicus TaxID=2174846 RepID=A0A2S1SZ49_9ACTN|nr:NAD(P)/FAD-dependent oxidoreductase [Streptomyces tirandamycinicus]AWI31527.1 FAD/NAD(P)-binding oxidoreductase [Streptomyces tirandamycinicus]
MTTSRSERGTPPATASTTTEEAPCDLAVVGAGPAGLAAAVTAAGLGLRVTLLDAGERPGGQYYRHPAPGLRAARPQALHHHWQTFTRLARRLRAHSAAGRLRHLPVHHVWTVLPERPARPGEPAPVWRLHAVAGEDADAHTPGDRGDRGDRDDRDGTAVTVRARTVLLATGAHERQLPFPGWTLPGVVGAGGAQAMLKSGLVLPGRRTVVAGSGPLLLAVASALATAGATVPAVVEAAAYPAYGRRPGALLRNPGKLAEGAAHGATLLRHGVRVLTRHAVTAAHGAARVEAVTVERVDRAWRPVPGSARRVPCDAVATGHGLVPQLELATGLGCATRRTADGTPALVLDGEQRTSVPGVWSAGETGGIGGAELALAEGELAARTIARVLHGTPLPPRTALLRARRDRLRAFGEVMAGVHRPGEGWTAWLHDTTPVCRCEEVPAGVIREAVGELGARDARAVKLLTRAGMGWCQGRVCGAALARLAGTDPAPDRRPLSCPVPLGHLAALPREGPPNRAAPPHPVDR